MVDKVIAIGIDHGWSHIKTRNSCFVSGVGEMGGEPMVWDNILEYNQLAHALIRFDMVSAKS